MGSIPPPKMELGPGLVGLLAPGSSYSPRLPIPPGGTVALCGFRPRLQLRGQRWPFTTFPGPAQEENFTPTPVEIQASFFLDGMLSQGGPLGRNPLLVYNFRVRRREAFSIALFFVGLFLAGSLVSFSPSSLGKGGGWFGLWGVRVALWMLQAFGYGSFALVIFLFLWAGACWSEGRLWFFPRFIAMLLFSSSFSSVLAGFFPQGIYAPGGVVGEIIFRSFLPLVGKAGTLLLAFLLLLLSLYSFSNFSLRRTLRYLQKIIAFFAAKVVLEVKVAVEKASRPMPSPGAKRGRKKREKKKPAKREPELFPVLEFQEPPLSFLKRPEGEVVISHQEVKENIREIEEKLREFGIRGKVVRVNPGPVVTVYEFKPEPGIRVSQVIGASSDVALALGAENVRIARLPGKRTIGIEVPNRERQLIYLREIIESREFIQSTSPLTLAIGKNVDGSPFVVDLRPFPHLLIGGATGMGKSVALNAMLLSMIYKAKPDEVRFLLIDPKRVEFPIYNGIPYLLSPVITQVDKAIQSLIWAVKEMERRLALLERFRVKNIAQYREKAELLRQEGQEVEPLPYIVIVIDELANLMLSAQKEMEMLLTRLAQEARAPGIHLILATQRPSTDIITGTIKNNFPARIALGVPSRFDSKTILDQEGAEKLLNKGDMLFKSPDSSILRRVHGAFVSEAELMRVIDYLKSSGVPRYRDIFSEVKERNEGSPLGLSSSDDIYIKAIKLVLTTGRTSATFLQSRLRIGFPRASRILLMMEEDGILSPEDPKTKKREILVDPREYLRSLEEGEG